MSIHKVFALGETSTHIAKVHEATLIYYIPKQLHLSVALGCSTFLLILPNEFVKISYT